MVYQGATGLYHFLINVIPFISNSVDTSLDTIYGQLQRIYLSLETIHLYRFSVSISQPRFRFFMRYIYILYM